MLRIPARDGSRAATAIIDPVRIAPIVLCALVASGCGRERQPNVAAGEERVFRKAGPQAAAGTGTSTREDEVVSPAEAVRRAKVRQIEKLFQDAKSADDVLDALDKLLQQDIRAPELVPYVARSLGDADSDHRIYGIKARVTISPDDALEDIQLVLRDRDPKVRQAAVESFSLLADPLPLDVLFTHLQSEQEPFVQQAVMLLFAARAPESAVARTLDLVRDLDVKAVAPVIDLARKYATSARPKADLLAYFLDRNDAGLRMQVARLLGEWGVRTPVVIGGLVRALNDSELGVRQAAFAALRPMSSLDFGYSPEASAADRKAALAKWRAWAAQATGQGAGAPESR
jgi:hypothetical protein